MARVPPFEEHEALFRLPPQSGFNAIPNPNPAPQLIVPAAYPSERGDRRRLIKNHGQDMDNVLSWLRQDLDVGPLNIIHKHLWMAGLPQIS
jgi:hypothetical protein